jgi:ribosomal protein S20
VCTLLFLAKEKEYKRVKQLWFTNLRNQVRQPQSRKMVRECIKQIAENSDDAMKHDLLLVSKIVGLSVNSLIPFPVGAKIRFENKVSKYTGIAKWEYQTTSRLNEEPWDMLCIEECLRARKVRLSFLDELQLAPIDAPLTGLSHAR